MSGDGAVRGANVVHCALIRGPRERVVSHSTRHGAIFHETCQMNHKST